MFSTDSTGGHAVTALLTRRHLREPAIRASQVPDALSAATLPLVAVLRQLGELLEALTDEQYVRKPVGVVPSSIGGHIRHNLDHVSALLAGVERGEIDYDQRERGTDVETNRQAALQAIERQVLELLAFAARGEDRRLRLRGLVTSASSPVVVETSVARELSFVLSHTIHHNALIGVMAMLLGVPIPERFGYAPSTIAHLEKSRCVR
jgi:uncharacterized damage-inducible protein DinB